MPIPYVFKDYRYLVKTNELDVLYNDTVEEVVAVFGDKPVDPKEVAYFAAMFAARRIAGALLDEAHDAGVTEEQYERLRLVQECVAHD
jgi:hypothetical protein